MERNRKESRVLDTVAELFDLPADVVAGLPRLEMVGSRQLYLEHHAGILAYSEEQIDVNTPEGILRVRGERLTLTAYLNTLLEGYGSVSSTLCTSRQEGDTLEVTLRAECREQIGQPVPIYTQSTNEPGGESP